MLIITTEELSNNNEATMKKVYKFLDVDLSFKAKQNSNKFNKGGYYKKNFFTKIIFQPSTFKNLIKKVVKPTPLLKILLAWTASIFSIKAEQIDNETETHLKKYFKEEVAKLTLECLRNSVPSEVPGIAFLSGGQSEIESSKNLNEINKINDTNFLITFSYGRGLQASALKAFGKDQNNQNNIQKAFDHRAKMNGLSSKGEWSENLEKEAAA